GTSGRRARALPAAGGGRGNGGPAGGRAAAPPAGVRAAPSHRVIALAGLREPIVVILLIMGFMSWISGKPLDGLLILLAGSSLAWDAGRRSRQVSLAASGSAEARTAEASPVEASPLEASPAEASQAEPSPVEAGPAAR